MADGATEGEEKDIVADRGVACEERQGGGEFVGGGWLGESGEEGEWDMGREEEVGGHEEEGEKVGDCHHLRGGDAAIAVGGGEDVVLGCVGEAVEEKVDGQEGEAVVGGRGCVFRGGEVGFGWVVEGEESDARCDGEDDKIFAEWVAALVKDDVQEHDGQQFAGFGECVGEVVDVGKGGIAERCSEGRGRGYQQEREECARRRKERSVRLGGKEEV